MYKRNQNKMVIQRILSVNQMSEAFLNSIFLALSGGFQDAYTYNIRNKVFSNAQTGNVVLMSQNLMEGKYLMSIKYLVPIISFALGVFSASMIQNHFKYAKKIHWRQGVLLIEIIILFIVGFLPKQFDLVATVLVSFSCALQVQSFRKVKGYSYASTMCIGNIRSGTDSLALFFYSNNVKQLRKAMYYYGVIFFFAIGAGIGGNLTLKFGICAIWICCVLLGISYLLMNLEKLR